MLSTPAKLIWPSQARAAPQVAAHGAGFIVKVQCRDLPVQSVPDGRSRSNHIWCACLGPQILGTLLILRTNWYLFRTESLIPNKHAGPQLQNGHAYYRGRTACVLLYMHIGCNEGSQTFLCDIEMRRAIDLEYHLERAKWFQERSSLARYTDW